MILFLQFTITDVRRFCDLRTQILEKPRWPSPRPFSEFVRSTGEVVERNKGGLQGWVGENFVCKIGKSIRFPERILFKNGIEGTNISKHLYANDHYTLTKYEFVFNLRTKKLSKNITHDTIKTIINELLMTVVKIKLNGKLEDVNLVNLHSKLKEFHYQNTTVKNLNQNSGSLEKIITCTPQCYFYLEKNEWAEDLGKNYKYIENVANAAKLYGAWYNHKNNPFRIWIHHRRSKSSSVETNRELRMTIMRLHSEYECLRNLVWGISKGLIIVHEFSKQSDELQQYFNIAIKTFLAREKDLEYQCYTKDFFDYFSKIFAKASPGDLERLHTQIESFNFRPSIKEKVTLYITKNEFMRTKFENHNSNIFSQGDNNEIHHNEVNQKTNASLDINLEKLLIEISQVLEEMRKEATTTDELKSVVALSEAKDAIERKDNSGVINALKSCGKFVIDVANKFSASILVEIIKSHSNFLS